MEVSHAHHLPSRVWLIGAATIAAVALAALPAAVAADDQIVGFWGGCVATDGETTVVAGEPVIVRWG